MKATTPKGPQLMKPRHEREQEAVATREHARNSTASPAAGTLDAASILKAEATSSVLIEAKRIAFQTIASKDFHKSRANSLLLDTLSLKVPGGRVWGGYSLAVAATLLFAI